MLQGLFCCEPNNNINIIPTKTVAAVTAATFTAVYLFLDDGRKRAARQQNADGIFGARRRRARTSPLFECACVYDGGIGRAVRPAVSFLA